MLRFCLCLWFIVISAGLKGQPSSYEEDIRRFLYINGTTSGHDHAFSRLFSQLPEPYAAIPDSLRQLLRRKVFEPEARRLVELMIPVYKKHFSHDEIRALIIFYESPAGVKFAGPNAALANDLAPVLHTWSAHLLHEARSFIESGKD